MHVREKKLAMKRTAFTILLGILVGALLNIWANESLSHTLSWRLSQASAALTVFGLAAFLGAFTYRAYKIWVTVGATADDEFFSILTFVGISRKFCLLLIVTSLVFWGCDSINNIVAPRAEIVVSKSLPRPEQDSNKRWYRPIAVTHSPSGKHLFLYWNDTSVNDAPPRAVTPKVVHNPWLREDIAWTKIEHGPASGAQFVVEVRDKAFEGVLVHIIRTTDNSLKEE